MKGAFPTQGWFRFRDDDLDGVHRTVAWMRDMIRPMAVTEALTLIARLAVDDIDLAAIQGKPAPPSPISAASRIVSQRMDAMARSGKRDADVDWTVELSWFPHTPDGTYGLIFAEREAWIDFCMNHPNAEPADFEEEPDWLSPVPFCLQGFSATLCLGDEVLREAVRRAQASPRDVIALLPPWDRRVEGIARFLAIRESGARTVDDVQRLDAALRTPEGMERLGPMKKRVATILTRRLNAEVFL